MGTGLLNKIVAFVANVCIVRILSRDAYGIFGYADNLVNFFLLVSGLGMINGVMQFGSESRPDAEKNAYFKFGLRFGSVFNLLLSLLIILYAIFIPISIPESRKYLAMLSLLPLTNYLFNFFCTLLRCQKENKLYAWVVNLNSILYAACAIAGAKLLRITGLVLALYAANVCSAFVGMALTRYNSEIRETEYRLNADQKKRIIHFSSVSCVNSAVANLLYLLDVFILGIIMKDAGVIASYKIATTIPTALLFLPQGINLFVYPYFAENNGDFAKIKKYTKLLFRYSLLMNGAITLILIVLAPTVITVIWGEKFLDAVPLLRILMLNYFVSASFRINAGNVLATLRRVNVTMVVSIVTGIANVGLDILFIRRLGAQGAAWATLTVMSLSSMMLMPAMIGSIKKLKIRRESI